MVKLRKIKYSDRKSMYFGPNFKETFERFNWIIEEDEDILESIPKSEELKVKKSGIFSHAVKYLVSKYVEANWQQFLKYKGIETNGDKKL